MTQGKRQTRQTIDAKRGEIRLRRELSRQELGEGVSIPETFSSDEILSVLIDSMEETRCVFDDLGERSVRISPFLEIGAERGHRSYVLTNEFSAEGFALDISIDALHYGNRLAEELSLDSAPIRICGDAANLPFRSNSFPLAFCFATLHHFPDPRLVIRETIRILQDGGHFYFDEEPTRGLITMPLWTRYGHKLSRTEQLLDRLGILGFVSEGGGLEREYGILENTFPLRTWIKAMQGFCEAELTVNRTLEIRFDPFQSSLKRWLGRMVGGVTSGFCRVCKDARPVHADNWIARLRCPTCSNQERDSRLQRLPHTQGLVCTHCGTAYPEHNGVLLLLSRDMQQKLYADSEFLA